MWGAWALVLALGCYHGLNPGMGWLLAVSNGMQARRAGAVFAAFAPIALGHFLAMAVVLLPFALLSFYLDRRPLISLAAGVLLLGFGVYKLLRRRHPRFLARIGPTHLLLWSFLMASAHGAGLMLLPVFLALCGPRFGAAPMMVLMRRGFGTAIAVSLVHTAAMLATGGLLAWLVYRYWGLGALRRAWFNLDLLWAACLLLSGSLALAEAL